MRLMSLESECNKCVVLKGVVQDRYSCWNISFLRKKNGEAAHDTTISSFFLSPQNTTAVFINLMTKYKIWQYETTGHSSYFVACNKRLLFHIILYTRVTSECRNICSSRSVAMTLVSFRCNSGLHLNKPRINTSLPDFMKSFVGFRLSCRVC
jgi:hypothetical protein